MIERMAESARRFKLKLRRDHSAATVLERLVVFCGGHLILPAPLKPVYIFLGNRAALSRRLPEFDMSFPNDIYVEHVGLAEYMVDAIPVYYIHIPCSEIEIRRFSQLCDRFEDNGYQL